MSHIRIFLPPGRAFISGSKDNVLNYAVIKNAFQSIAAEGPSVNGNPKITLNQCVIDNSYDAGIIALNSSISATNCLISNCGKNIAIEKGGDYEFTHCTVVSYSNNYIQHKDPVLIISDKDGTALDALFRNCIFWGENDLIENEVVVDKTGSNGEIIFDQVLWRVKTTPANSTIITPQQPINNQSPQFDSIDVAKNYYDFRLNRNQNPPAVDAGTNTGITIDLDGNTRPVGTKPDLGCFEKQ